MSEDVPLSAKIEISNDWPFAVPGTLVLSVAGTSHLRPAHFLSSASQKNSREPPRRKREPAQVFYVLRKRSKAAGWHHETTLLNRCEIAACSTRAENAVVRVGVNHAAASTTAKPTPMADKPPITDANHTISRKLIPQGIPHVRTPTLYPTAEGQRRVNYVSSRSSNFRLWKFRSAHIGQRDRRPCGFASG